jgi:hypothetical protein
MKRCGDRDRLPAEQLIALSPYRPDRYLVRVIDIEGVDNNTLVVTDSTNDALSLGPGVGRPCKKTGYGRQGL